MTTQTRNQNREPMASIKVKFRPSTNENKEGTIYYQIIQNRVIRQLKTDYRLFMHEWSEEESEINTPQQQPTELPTIHRGTY